MTPTRLAPLLLLLVLGGCGFQLRTWDVGSALESAWVTSNPRNPMEQPLERALRQAGIAEAPSPEQAAVVVELLDSRQDRRSITVSGQARAAEYETILGVLYRVTDGQGNELVPEQWLERERVFRVDRDNLVGSSEEQALLEREMQNDLVQQILRTLNAVAAEDDADADQAP
jgi:LPS-assembly lipoprotein